MAPPVSFNERVATHLERISRAERRVARFIQENREETLIASASTIAQKAGTSDATVIRTAKALGFGGMEDLRRTLAGELRDDLSPAGRLARTLSEVGDDPAAAFEVTLEIHRTAIERLRRDISPEQFGAAVQHIIDAKRVFVFGIGPSSAMANYFAFQLGRFGLDAHGLTQTGLLLADGLRKLRGGDLLMILAYTRVYQEVAALLDEADRRGVKKMLISDTLGSVLRDRIDLTLPVSRGRTGSLSMHTATLGLIEALLVGIATKRPAETMASLTSLNALRAQLVGEPIDLPAATTGA